MSTPSQTHGFSLIELLLVLAIIGIISGIAIPTFLGQRRRARIIGDAMSNAKVLGMILEQVKAENGVYGPANATVAWQGSNTPTTLTGFTTNPCPSFAPNKNSQLYFSVTLPTALTYQITVNDPGLTGTPMVFQTDQTGAVLYRMY